MINVNQLTIEQNIVKDQCDAWHGKMYIYSFQKVSRDTNYFR